MKLLLDQDIYATTDRFLRGLGYEVVNAVQLGLSQAEDEQLRKNLRIILLSYQRPLDLNINSLVFIYHPRPSWRGLFFPAGVLLIQNFSWPDLCGQSPLDPGWRSLLIAGLSSGRNCYRPHRFQP